MITVRKPLASDDTLIRSTYLGSLASLIFAAAAILIGQLVDGIVIGKFLGTECVAAFGLVGPLYLLVSAVGGITSAGASTYCGRLIGMNRLKDANKAYTTNIVVTVLFCVISSAVVLAFAGGFVNLLGAEKGSALYTPAIRYVYGLAPSFLFMSLLTMFMSMFYLDGGKKLVLIGIVISTTVNILGDLLNVFVFKGGMLGMSLATTASYVVGFFVLLLHFKGEHMLKLVWEDFSFRPMKEIVRFGLPKAANKCCNFLRSFVLNRILILIATATAIAALSVRTNLSNFFAAISTGIGHATVLLGAIYAGEQDKDSLRKTFAVSLKYGFLIAAAISLIVFIFARPLVSICSSDPEVMDMAVVSLRWYMASFPLYTVVIVFLNMYQSIGRTGRTSVVCALDEFALVSVCALVFGFAFGVSGIWAAFFFGEVLMLVIIFLWTWKYCGHFPRTLEDFMLLPSDFDFSDRERYSARVHTETDAVQISEEIRQLLLRNRVNEKNANMMALCVEELTVNIVRWGFRKGSKREVAEVYLVNRKGEWLLRIRDNCGAFNPEKWYNLHQCASDYEKIGIRMVFGMASDIQYTNTLQLNNLLIKIPESESLGE